MTIIVDLLDAEHTERFRAASLFQKNAVVSARQVKTPEHLDTILANGFLETSREVPVGYWIITNPGGEQYAKTDEQFRERYEFLGRDGLFRAKGIIRAFQNTTGERIEITTPWGAKQYGDAECYVATTVDESFEPTDFRYIIGKQEFDDTYEPAEAVSLLLKILQDTADNSKSK